MNCHGCDKDTDLLHRVSRPGAKGVFYCESCVKEREESITEFMEISPESLKMIQFDLVKLVCAAKGCCRFTKARDYGIHPVYYHPRMVNLWHNTDTHFFLCPGHRKLHERLLKRGFEKDHIYRRLIDENKREVFSLP